MKSNWLVIVNEFCDIIGGDRLVCKTRAEALNIAAFTARVLYNADVCERHVFVVKRVETEAEATIVSKEDLEYRVIYHYSIAGSDSMKWIFLYDGWCDNQKKLCFKFI